MYEETRKKEGVAVELLDLRDFPMPFLDQVISPALSGGKYANSIVKKWAEKIKDGDAFIIVTPEYNQLGGNSLALKVERRVKKLSKARKEELIRANTRIDEITKQISSQLTV